MSDDRLVVETGEAETVTGEQTGSVQELTVHDSTNPDWSDSLGVKISHPAMDNGLVVFYNLPDGQVTQNHDLGKLLERFGATLTEGGEANIPEYVGEGTRVSYEVVEEESDDAEYDTTLNIVPESVRPPGEDYESEEEVGSSEPDKVISEGLENMLDEIMPADRASIINMLATEGTGEEVQEFQAALEEGLFVSKEDGRLALE